MRSGIICKSAEELELGQGAGTVSEAPLGPLGNSDFGFDSPPSVGVKLWESEPCDDGMHWRFSQLCCCLVARRPMTAIRQQPNLLTAIRQQPNLRGVAADHANRNRCPKLPVMVMAV
jgi:hypothetical protein